VSDEQDLIDSAIEAMADGRALSAVERFGDAVKRLEEERQRGAVSDERLTLELAARAGVRLASPELLPSDSGELARQELALWDLAIDQMGLGDLAEQYGGSLVSIGATALLSDDLALAEAVGERLGELFAAAEPPEVLEADHLSAAALYLDARSYASDLDLRLGRLDDSIHALGEVIELLQRWGRFPSDELPLAEVTLREANLLGRYLRRCIEAGRDSGDLADHHDRYVDLLVDAFETANATGDEEMAAAALRLLENAAEYASGCGRRSAVPQIEEVLARGTRALAERGGVLGQVLYGDLPSTLERISRYR
jgi:hypothetical protein